MSVSRSAARSFSARGETQGQDLLPLLHPLRPRLLLRLPRTTHTSTKRSASPHSKSRSSSTSSRRTLGSNNNSFIFLELKKSADELSCVFDHGDQQPATALAQQPPQTGRQVLDLCDHPELPVFRLGQGEARSILRPVQWEMASLR